MNQYTTRTGQTLRWSGRNICICTQCDEVFNSPAAFDAHIRRGSGKATHNISKLFRNAAGRLVTSLHEAGATFGSSPAATESDQLVPR